MSHLRVVTQRITRAKLLIDAAKDVWATAGTGLILYISFTKACPLDKNFRSICKSLLGANLTTSSFQGWQADHSDATSVLNLCSRGIPQSLVLVPQASLVTKLIPGDKTLKYHAQSTKSDAEILFRRFERALREACIEALCPPKKKTPGLFLI